LSNAIVRTYVIVKCFGEWFQVLSTKVAAQKGFFCLYSPLLRWLQEIAAKQIEMGESYGSAPILLKALHVFCGESSDLVRAFMLATLCREAVANATRRKEEKTYGKLSSTDAGKSFLGIQIAVAAAERLNLMLDITSSKTLG
jgi:hypothetical protein